MTPDTEVTEVVETETIPDPPPVPQNEPPHLSVAQLEHWKGEIIRKLEEDKTATARERQEDREEIARLREWIDDRKKRDEEEAKAKDDHTTIVAPPSHLAPTQPSPTAPEVHGDGAPDDGKRRGRWKNAW